jgi:hypothetical protein
MLNLVVNYTHHGLQGRIMMELSTSCGHHDGIVTRLWAVDGPWVVVVSHATSRQRGVLPLTASRDGIVVQS